jgi:hypothetical protein
VPVSVLSVAGSGSLAYGVPTSEMRELWCYSSILKRVRWMSLPQ